MGNPFQQLPGPEVRPTELIDDPWAPGSRKHASREVNVLKNAPPVRKPQNPREIRAVTVETLEQVLPDGSRIQRNSSVAGKELALRGLQLGCIASLGRSSMGGAPEKVECVRNAAFHWRPR